MQTIFKVGLAVMLLGLAQPAVANETFQNATTVAEAKRAGGQQITGESIRRIVTNRTVNSPKFSWTFKANGRQSSKAHNSSWKSSGTWEIRGHQLCRTDDGMERCSDVYILNRDLKFTETGSKTKLSPWFVSY